MSKKHGRPKAQSPEPLAPETVVPEVETTEASNLPEAAPTLTVPPLVLGLARAVEAKWGVPKWLTVFASWTGSKFHTETPGTNNACGIMAYGTMQKNEAGWAWFGNIPISYDQFGAVCHKLGLSYSDPEQCIALLAETCPKITTVPYTQFMEAK